MSPKNKLVTTFFLQLAQNDPFLVLTNGTSLQKIA